VDKAYMMLTERIITSMSKAKVHANADYRFAARCETRAVAVGRLIEAPEGRKRRASKPKTHQ